jgi:hypothetical protein
MRDDLVNKNRLIFFDNINFFENFAKGEFIMLKHMSNLIKKQSFSEGHHGDRIEIDEYVDSTGGVLTLKNGYANSVSIRVKYLDRESMKQFLLEK